MTTRLTDSRRAQRIRTEFSLRYRVRGKHQWHEGTTENISKSGVLFWGQQPMESNTPVEISFFLPAELGNERASVVLCSGNIVRIVRRSDRAGLLGYGVRIVDYHFFRGPRDKAAQSEQSAPRRRRVIHYRPRSSSQIF
jgi:PilZ domain-containing protein